MIRRALLGIDLGTTGTKIIAIDDAGRILSEVQRDASLLSPHAGWAEVDPSEWWANVCTGIPDCLARADVQAGDVLAVGVSGMVPATILVGPDGQPLRRSIQQNDARAFAEVDEFKVRLDEQDLFHRTGALITQQSIGPKLLWLARHEPEVFQQAAWVMGSYDYINYLLTGVPNLEQNWALESGLYDLHQQDWLEEPLKLSGLTRDQLPAVHPPGRVIGTVFAEAARQTGLKHGTPVVSGGADHVASAFAAGVRQNGDVLVKLGGAGDILYALDRLVLNRSMFLDYHMLPGLYLINGCMASSGSIIKWFREQFAAGLDYPNLDAEARDIPAGSEGLLLLPYFIGEKTPIFDPHARGVFFGLTLGHTRAHLYHAILEGISFGFYHHLQVLKEAGLPVRRVRVTNGGAHSALWRQVTADVLGLPLEKVAGHPGSSLGAAFAAGMGAGVFSDWTEIERFTRVEPPTLPDPARHETYRGLFPLYRELYLANQSLFRKLAGDPSG
jgi:xylulokinase